MVERNLISRAYQLLRERYTFSDVGNMTLDELIEAVSGEVSRMHVSKHGAWKSGEREDHNIAKLQGS